MLNIQRSLSLLTLSILMSLLLSGCVRTTFGMPEDQFNQLNDEQKQQVIAGYNQKKLIEAQNAPLIDAIGTAGRLLNANKNVPLSSSSSSSCHMEGTTQVCNSSGSSSSAHFGFN